MAQVERWLARGIRCGENSNAILANVFVEKEEELMGLSDVFEELESLVLQSRQLKDTRERLDIIGGALTELGQKALARFREAAERKGEKWEWELKFVPEPSEEDESPSFSIETVEIESDRIEISSESKYGLESEGAEAITVFSALTMSSDGQTLKRAFWREAIDFKGGKKQVLREIDVVIRDAKVVRISITDNFGEGSYPRVHEDIARSHHELIL